MAEQNALNQGDQHKALESGDMEVTSLLGEREIKPYFHFDLGLFERRKQMLIAHYSGLLNPAAMKQIAIQFSCSEKVVYTDWARRERWEPFIWKSIANVEDAKKLIQQLELARETALLLMKNPRLGGNARVGAIARFTEAIRTEIELLQGMGVLPVQTQPAVVVNQNVTTNNTRIESTVKLLAEYEHLIAEAAGAEAGDLQKNNSGESVRKADSDAEASEVSVA